MESFVSLSKNLSSLLLVRETTLTDFANMDFLLPICIIIIQVHNKKVAKDVWLVSVASVLKKREWRFNYLFK